MSIHHFKFDRITVDPMKCLGKPCIRDLRIPVFSILAYLSSGISIDDLLGEWLELEREDILQALGYASLALEEDIVFLEKTEG